MTPSTATKFLVLMGVLLAFVSRSTPIGAIETATFGLDVVERSDDSRLHVPVRAGETTTGRLRVWNKSQAPLTLQVGVVPAQVDEAGTVSLGGDGEGVGWVSVDPDRVELAPAAEQVVTVRVEAPRKISGHDLVVAVQVEPAIVEGAAQPAVVERLALTTYLEPDEDSLIASLGLFPWIALAVLLVVATALVRSALRRRRAGSAPPIG